MPHAPDALIGSMLGLAVGDALGLPLENLSPRRGPKLFPHLDRYQFFFGRGMFSDDTGAALASRGKRCSGLVATPTRSGATSQ